MDLIIALEHRFVRTPDGFFRTDTLYKRSFWDRYLAVFDRVRIVARVAEGGTDQQFLDRVDDDRVRFEPLPCYVGPRQFVHKLSLLRRAVAAIDLSSSAVLLRVPGMVGSLLLRVLPASQPYAVEVVGDPRDVFSRGALQHPLRPFFRWWFSRQLRILCKGATCALYVTQRALQERYPPRRRASLDFGDAGPLLAFSAADVEMGDVAYASSNVDLSEDAFANVARQNFIRGTCLSIVCVGTFAQLYKGQRDLVDAVALCAQSGLDVQATFVGDGGFLGQVKKHAESRGVANRLTFVGAVPGGQPVRDILDRHHLFVLPSHCEGLPRAMVEAMARGLPCIGTRVGGIPELLPETALVDVGDVRGLADSILALANDPARMASSGRDNLALARQYHERVLQPKRLAFYKHLARVSLNRE